MYKRNHMNCSLAVAMMDQTNILKQQQQMKGFNFRCELLAIPFYCFSVCQTVTVCFTGSCMQPPGVRDHDSDHNDPHTPRLAGPQRACGMETLKTFKCIVYYKLTSDYKCYPEVEGIAFIKLKCWIQRIKVLLLCWRGGTLLRRADQGNLCGRKMYVQRIDSKPNILSFGMPSPS